LRLRLLGWKVRFTHGSSARERPRRRARKGSPVAGGRRNAPILEVAARGSQRVASGARGGRLGRRDRSPRPGVDPAAGSGHPSRPVAPRRAPWVDDSLTHRAHRGRAWGRHHPTGRITVVKFCPPPLRPRVGAASLPGPVVGHDPGRGGGDGSNDPDQVVRRRGPGRACGSPHLWMGLWKFLTHV
jgi:hypothetical protein